MNCRNCRFAIAVPGTDLDGFCHRLPPDIVRDAEAKSTSSFFPPVNLDKCWCGEWSWDWHGWMKYNET